MEEGVYLIKRIEKLPKRGNSNYLYAIKSGTMDKLYRWKSSGKYETIIVGSDAIDSILAQLANIEDNIDVIEIDISNNATNISTLQTDVSANTTDISNLQTDVSNNATNISTLQTDVSANTTDISNLQTDVSTNASNISTLQTDVSANTSNISTLQTDVSANTSNISTLQTDVSANTTDISNLQTDVSTNASNISTLQTDVSANTSNISTLQTDVSANTSNISTLQTDVSANTSNISTLQTDVSANTSNISTLQTDVSANTSNISTLQTDVSANTSNISTLQTDVSANTSNISSLQSQITTLGTSAHTNNTTVNNLPKTDANGDHVDSAISELGGSVNIKGTGSVSSLTSKIDFRDSSDTLAGSVGYNFSNLFRIINYTGDINIGDLNSNVGINVGTPQTRLHVVTSNGIRVAGTGGIPSTQGAFVEFYDQNFNAKLGSVGFNGTTLNIENSVSGVVNVGSIDGSDRAVVPGIFDVTSTSLFHRIGGNGARVMIASTSNADQSLSVEGNASKTGGGSWATFSDIRTKENIEQFKDGLELVMKMNPVSFNYNELSGYGEEYLQKRYINFIAQDVEEIAPYMVEKFDDSEASGLKDKRVLDESALTKILVNAIKELKGIVDDQTAKISKLENLINNDKNNSK